VRIETDGARIETDEASIECDGARNMIVRLELGYGLMGLES
jgi:hypothetical protein